MPDPTPTQVLSVACPTCGELAGRRCVKNGSFGSLPVEPHPSRITAASEQDRQLNPDSERWERFAEELEKMAFEIAVFSDSRAIQSRCYLDISAIARCIARGGK